MNITELARRLRVNTEELKNVLPGMGFDFGRKTIKIPDLVAWKIINAWPSYVREQQKKKEAERDTERLTVAREAAKDIILPPIFSVKEFAAYLGLPVTRVIAELMKNGILAAMNERIDYTTASIIANDLGFAVKPKEKDTGAAVYEEMADDTVKELMQKELGQTLTARPPVVVVMGHVDHGKTTLLDAIRRTNVVAKEAGGITQHIGAYQVTVQSSEQSSRTKQSEVEGSPAKKEKILRQAQDNFAGRKITFIDTPGHEAFTTMRSRGARVADVAVLVVAADDGVQPQTLEALSIIQATKVPYAIAVNKMDKPSADPERVKRELSEKGVIPEDWGGPVPFVQLSAKTGDGIDSLLDVLLILADINKDQIMADPNGRAIGTVIESHVDDKEGVLATILVQNGTLKRGDTLGVRGVLYGRVRALKDWARKDVLDVKPGTPVQVLGLKSAPEVGDVIAVPLEGEELSTQKFKHRATQEPSVMITAPVETGDETARNFNMVLKADVLGSLEALVASVEKINTPEVKARVIAKGLGNITETDVTHAETGQAVVYGFNVNASLVINDLARTKGVDIRMYKIIYELLDNVKLEMEKLLAPELIRTAVGRIKILRIFRQEKNVAITGGRVEEGKAIKKLPVIVMRNGVFIGKGKLTEVQSGKQPVDELPGGSEGGFKIEGKFTVEEGDVVEIIREEERERHLED